VVPPLAVDLVLETCLLEMTGQAAARQPGLPARNVLPAANQHADGDYLAAGFDNPALHTWMAGSRSAPHRPS
jgi:hypothetical protein